MGKISKDKQNQLKGIYIIAKSLLRLHYKLNREAFTYLLPGIFNNLL